MLGDYKKTYRSFYFKFCSHRYAHHWILFQQRYCLQNRCNQLLSGPFIAKGLCNIFLRLTNIQYRLMLIYYFHFSTPNMA